MKKRLLGKQLFLLGSILTVAFACQPKTPKAPAPAENENPMQNDNDDDEGDSGTYGDGDTSAACEKESAAPFETVEPALEVTDVKLAAETTAAEVLAQTEAQENAPAEQIVVLESVAPVEIVAEHQGESAENASSQN